MKSWLENYGTDSAEDIHTERLIYNFATVSPYDDFFNAPMDQLLRLVRMREDGEKSLRKVTPSRHRETPAPSLPKSLKNLKFLELDPLEIARQLTIMEASMWGKIQPVECLKKAWSDKTEDGNLANDFSPNIKAMIAMTNQVSISSP